ncbi:hypothetical protein GCM10029964_079850 [Kibdelosporangium lantanae]
MAVKLVEFGTADQIDDSGESYRAADGSALIAFRTSTTVAESAKSGTLEQIAVGVSVDGTQRALPDFFGSRSTTGPSTASYVVAVPEQRRTVDLQLKSAGLTQAIDLLEGKPKETGRRRSTGRPTARSSSRKRCHRPPSRSRSGQASHPCRRTSQ